MYTVYHNAIPLVAIALWAHMGNKQFSVLALKIALGRSSLKTSSLMKCYYITNQAKPQSSYYCRKKLTNSPNIIMTLAIMVFCV